MDEKNFNKAINAYKVGNFAPLKEFISNVEELDGSQWYFISDLMLEERVFNMPMGSNYIYGTLPIFIEALEKTSKENGKLDLSKKFGAMVLAEEPENFNKFMDLYNSKVITKTSYTLSSTLLSINTGKIDNFWENFFLNYLDSFLLEEFDDQQVYNITTNTNKIFDLDKSQHKCIARAIESDSHYPFGKVMQQMLTYVIEFDKFTIPRAKLNRLGRNEHTLLMCKKIATIIEKVELEIELKNSTSLSSNKAKPKL
jgi:hypothetical protein